MKLSEEDLKEIYYCLKYSLKIPEDLKKKIFNILTINSEVKYLTF
jgi:hypothetical protein